MKKIISHILDESINLKKEFMEANTGLILKAADMMAVCLASGHKIMIFGNGGSAADAQHLAAEFVNRFQAERPPLAAIALTTDTSVLTSIANDYNFNEIFSKQILALGKKGDVALGISTSGNSENVLKALEAAKNIGAFTIGFSGKSEKMRNFSDMLFSVPSDVTARIQEIHILAGHILCDLVEKILFPEKFDNY